MELRDSDLERFFAKVNYHTDNGCHEWTAAKNPAGYGRFFLGKKLQLAHRVAWVVYNGSIPDGLWVLHKCDNPSCVHPGHLFTGTPKDNSQDKLAKGRDHQRRKTHCPQGHAYDEVNTRIEKSTWRACRVCDRERKKKEYWRKRHKEWFDRQDEIKARHG